MRRTPLRTRLFLLSAAFSVVFVGAVLSVAYLVITGAMRGTAQATATRLATPAAVAVGRAAEDAREAAADGGGADVEAVARADFLARMRDLAGSTSFSEGDYALYDDSGRAVWRSAERGLAPASTGRERAARERVSVGVERLSGAAFSGLLGPADLGAFVLHVPVDMPGERAAVLDIVYTPYREEAIIDSVRGRMLLLALVAAVISVAVMQAGAAWVLRLVDDLRQAADSVGAGDLDVKLPEPGDNEVGDLARSINEMIGRLRRRAEAQTRFVADASHELATPVAGIRGYVNILRVWGAEEAELRDEAIRAIDRESRRMARLCAELLSLIRSDRDIEFRSIRFDLNARSREVLADAATRHMDRQLEFIGPESGQLFMVGDPDRIEEVVAILVDNAAKYTPAGGHISVTTRRRRENVVVEVSDTGPGIPEEDIPYIFERFYRSDSSRSKETGGFGLGLAIAKRIVEASGGSIDVRSTEGVGTTFFLRLPRGRA